MESDGIPNSCQAELEWELDACLEQKCIILPGLPGGLDNL
jgi:hypothetical protein